MRLDAFDIKILVALQRDGRMTKLKLAEKIGLSPSPCWARLKRLEQAGIIRGYRAVVDIDHLLHTATVLVSVSLASHCESDFERFETAAQTIPEIVECYATGGGVDYMLRVVVIDIDHYQRLIDELLAAGIGIERYFTYIVTKVVKRYPGYPIQHLLDAQKRAAVQKQSLIRARRRDSDI